MLAPLKRQNKSRNGKDASFLLELMFTGGRGNGDRLCILCLFKVYWGFEGK